MFNARDLLGQMMQSGTSGSASHRVGHAMGPKGLGSSNNPLGQLLQGLGGGASGSSGSSGGLAGMAKSMFGGGTGGSGRGGGNPLAVGGLGALAGAVLGGGGMKGALGGGALALLGSLAMSSLRNQNQGGAQSGAQAGAPGQAPATPEDLAREAPLGLREPQNAEEEQELERRALLIVRAMVSAAKADGRVDAAEIGRITGKLQESGADQEARAFVAAEMKRPVDIEGLARDVPDAEVAVEVYAASLLAIEVDTPAEQAYLRQLAQRLGLGTEVTRNVHELLGAPTPS